MKSLKKVTIYVFVIFSLIVFVCLYINFKSHIQVDLRSLNDDFNNKKILTVYDSRTMPVKYSTKDDGVGYLTIGKIGLYNEIIKEGVDDKVLKNNIGHFSNTSLLNGNICLAAHNYSIDTSNLFRDIHKLEIGDTIFYKRDDAINKYIIYKKFEIKDNDFSILENTNENILTLITCINNRKDVRLCIKAKGV